MSRAGSPRRSRLTAPGRSHPTGPRRSRLTAPGLVRRQLGAEPGTAVLVAVTVLLVSFVVSLWPRAVDTLLGDDLRDRLEGMSAARRDPSGWTTWFPDDLWPGVVGSTTGSVGAAVDGSEVFADWEGRLASSRADAGPEVAQIITGSEVTLTRRRDDVEKGPRADDVVAMTLAVRTDPHLTDRVTLIEGRLPGEYDLTGLFDEGADLPALLAERPVEIVASVETAERMQWRVGESRSLTGVMPFRFTLVGTFDAVDPGADHWSHLESTLFPYIVEDGNVGTTVHGTAYADVSAVGALVVPNGLRADYWHTTDTDAAARTDRSALLAELRTLLDLDDLTSELPDRLEATARRQATFTAVLRVLAVGPVGVAAGVLWLTAALAVARRRTALGLAAARGGSGTAIRGAMAAQGLLLGLPAAAVGAVAAALVLPRDVGAAGWVLPLVVGVAPAAAMALAAGSATTRRDAGRPDATKADRERAEAIAGRPAGTRQAWRRALGSRRGWRIAATGGLVVLAVLAVVTLRQRGLGAGGAGGAGASRGADGDAGADPLVLATPVLLAVAGAVLAMRLQPLVMRAVARALHRRRGLLHFLGAAQATRGARASLPAVVALVLGVVVTVFSVVTWSTVRAGLDHTAATAVGADLAVSAEGLTNAGAEAVAGVDGVASVAVVRSAGVFPLEIGGNDSTVTVLTVDVDELADVQAPIGLDPLPVLQGGPVEAPPAVVGGLDADDLDRDVVLTVGTDRRELPLTPVAGARSVPGVTSGTAWVVMDTAAWPAATGEDARVDRLLLRLTDGTDPGVVTSAVADALGTEITVTSRAAARDVVGDGALVRGVTVGLLAAAGLAGVLSVVVVLLVLALGAPARGRLAALLTTVGAPRRTASRLVAWEVGPLLATGVVVGAVVGAVLAALVLPAADLTAFTAGATQPPLVADPAALGALAGVGAAVVALAAVVATLRARLRRAAVVLREEE